MAGWLDQEENAARQVETEKTPTRRGARERKERLAFRNAVLGRPRTLSGSSGRTTTQRRRVSGGVDDLIS